MAGIDEGKGFDFESFFKPGEGLGSRPAPSEEVSIDKEAPHAIVKEDIKALFRNIEEKLPKSYLEGEADLAALYSLSKILLETSSLPSDKQMNAFMSRLSLQNSKRDMSERVARLLRVLGPKI